MSAYVNFASGSGAATNLDLTYESVGWDTSTGTGVTLTANASANTKSTSWISIGTTGASDWSGFYLRIYSASISGGRYLIDLSFDGSTVKVPNIYVQPSTSTVIRTIDIWIPLQVTASTNVRAKIQCSTGGGTLIATLQGVVANSSAQPGFTAATALVTADTTNSRASTATINLQGTGATSWTSLVDPLGSTYGAILMTVSNSSTPSNVQTCRISLATGPTGGGSEVFAGSIGALMVTSGALLPGIVFAFQKSFASGIRISGNIQAAAAGSPDTFNIGLIGFS